MIDINYFNFPYSSLKNISVAKAMQRFIALTKKNITQFIYQSLRNVFGITQYLPYLKHLLNLKFHFY